MITGRSGDKCAHRLNLRPVLDRRPDAADHPLFDTLVYPDSPVANFHTTNDWMEARIR